MSAKISLNLPLERLMKERLKQDDPESARSYWSKYCTAYEKLKKVWRTIQTREPYLTDHSESHIRNVIEMSEIANPCLNRFTGYELYLLAMSILFHDTGILLGRDDHQNKALYIYQETTKDDELYTEDEEDSILSIVSSHCGYTAEGSADTIAEKCPKDITDEHGKDVRLQELAAILRFTDELCEGKQRTCTYMINNNLLPRKSRIFHEYADSVTIRPQPRNNRIVIQVGINMKSYPKTKRAIKSKLSKIIGFSIGRLYKLFAELQYAASYCNDYNVYKSIEFSLRCKINGKKYDIDKGGIILSTRILPDHYEDVVKGIEDGKCKQVVDEILTLEAVNGY